MIARILAYLVLSVFWVAAQAQNTGPVGEPQQPAGVEALKAELKRLQEEFERSQREQRKQIEDLTRKVEELTRSAGLQGTGTNAPPVTTAEAEEKAKLEAELTRELGGTGALTNNASGTEVAAKPWSPAGPLTVARSGSAYMNISFDALTDFGWSTAPQPSEFLQLGDHDPNQRGFTLPNAEIALDGAVDPYFKGFANIVLKLDQNNETSIELEETFLQSSSLPANLQVKAGQFFAAFGRQNAQHPHQWGFVDEPVILARTLGPEGLRNVGVQGSWLVPVPFFTEASLGVFNGEGQTAFSFRNPGEDGLVHGRATSAMNISGPGDLLYVPRLASSFDLTDQQSLVTGISAAFAPNDTGAHERTRIFGFDVYWKWKAANADAGFPFVSWQTEALLSRFEAGADPQANLPQETLRDWGFYSQVLWGFKPRWVAGLRGEWADGSAGAYDPYDVYRGQRTRVTPDLTFYPTEFSKLRLQYNYDKGELFGTEHSIWFQVEFLLGAHGAHKF